MAKRQKFSKDPKVSLLSLEEFLSIYDFFKGGIPKRYRWSTDTVPSDCETYFKITEDRFIAICYGMTFSNFGMDIKEKLETIQIAFRDGKTEYELYDAEIETLKKERSKFKKSKRLDDEIAETEKAKKRLPKYQNTKQTVEPKGFKYYLIDTGYKTDTSKYKHRYVVFDVETNGTRKNNDDLLSLSIYDPSTGICYNRYFPLDLQPVILTGFIHGITDEMLAGSTHITQEEMDHIINYFDLKNSILLSFSGGKGTFDSSFVINYCERHGVHGFEDLQYKNIKELIPAAPFGTEGQLSKDNLCRMFGIEGVTDLHSSMNDCVLEWKLFEKLARQPVFFIQNHLYKYTKDYIIPISYITKHPELPRFAGIKIPPVLGYTETIFEYDFPKTVLKSIKKFPTNITGITIENAINSLLGVEKQDNYKFLADNKRHLEYVGSLDSRIEEIPIITENDGTIKTTDPQYNDYVAEINNVTKVIMENLVDTIKFIKTNIFTDSRIMSQEMVISEDNKILALCDLSSSKSIMEIKTMNIMKEDEYGLHISALISRQLYYQRKGRDVYALSIVFDKHSKEKTFEEVVDGLRIKIYKVDLKVVEIIPKVYKPGFFATKILQELIKDNSLTYPQLAKKTGFSERKIQSYVRELKDNGFIVREGLSNQNGVWRVLKDENGNLVPEDQQVKFRTIDYSENYKQKVLEMTEGKIVCTNYINSQTPAEYECMVCGHKWSTRAEHFKHRQKHGCPKCKAGREA